MCCHPRDMPVAAANHGVAQLGAASSPQPGVGLVQAVGQGSWGGPPQGWAPQSSQGPPRQGPALHIQGSPCPSPLGTIR